MELIAAAKIKKEPTTHAGALFPRFSSLRGGCYDFHSGGRGDRCGVGICVGRGDSGSGSNGQSGICRQHAVGHRETVGVGDVGQTRVSRIETELIEILSHGGHLIVRGVPALPDSDPGEFAATDINLFAGLFPGGLKPGDL